MCVCIHRQLLQCEVASRQSECSALLLSEEEWRERAQAASALQERAEQDKEGLLQELGDLTVKYAEEKAELQVPMCACPGVHMQ